MASRSDAPVHHAGITSASIKDSAKVNNVRSYAGSCGAMRIGHRGDRI